MVAIGFVEERAEKCNSQSGNYLRAFAAPAFRLKPTLNRVPSRSGSFPSNPFDKRDFRKPNIGSWIGCGAVSLAANSPYPR
jgi:hypothetical protein